LVTSTDILLLLVKVDGGSNLARLALDSGDDVASVAVKAGSVSVEANTVGDLAGDLLEVNLLLGNTDFTEQHNLTRVNYAI
jgi:hypothetical protein